MKPEFKEQLLTEVEAQLGTADQYDDEEIANWYVEDRSQWPSQIEDFIEHQVQEYGLTRIPDVLSGKQKMPYKAKTIMQSLKQRMQ